MLGWSGVCYQFYQIQDLEVQSKLMDIDGYKKVEVNKDSQLIIYSFPREDCIRLDELLKSISSDYVKIYGAQALRLIQDIIEHHHRILEKKKFHGNLTSRNVWIVFDQWNQKTEGGERFRCKFSKLKYKIYFTGYLQSSQNDNYNLENECSEVAVDILNVLEYCQTGYHKRWQSKKEMNLEKMKLMLLPYAQEQQQLFEQIKQIFQRYPYIQDEQRFKDLDCEQYSLICIRGGYIYKYAEQSIKTLFQQQPIEQNTLKDKLKWRMQTIMQEMQFWQLLPEIVKECQSTLIYQDPQNKVKKIEPQIINLIQRIHDLNSQHYGSMLKNFQNILNQEQGQHYKFETKLEQFVTEPYYLIQFRAYIAQYLNDLDSFKSLNDDWLKNEMEFEAKIFKKHISYLLGQYEKLLEKQEDAIITQLL